MAKTTMKHTNHRDIPRIRRAILVLSTQNAFGSGKTQHNTKRAPLRAENDHSTLICWQFDSIRASNAKAPVTDK
jgi:hypothetical protein